MYQNLDSKLRRFLFLLTVFICAAPFFDGIVAAQSQTAPQTMVSIGDSRIYRDLANAKNAAISESLQFAVQTVAAQMLSRAELTENFELVSTVLSEKRDEFIQGYKILREMRTEKYYRVLVQSTIMGDQIRRHLAEAGLTDGSERLPSVLFMVAEQQIYDIGYQYWWRPGGAMVAADNAVSPLMKALAEKGFNVIRPQRGQIPGQVLDSGQKLGPTPANHEAARLANQLGADLVVVGTATVKSTANRMGQNIRTYKGIVNVRVLRTDTGEKLTTLRQQEVAMGEDPESTSENALSDAAHRTGKQLGEQVLSLWQKARKAEDLMTLSVSGKNILPYLEKFRRAVRNTKGVNDLQTNEITPDSAILTIESDGTPQELADNLILQSYERFGINITEITSDGLKIELTSE